MANEARKTGDEPATGADPGGTRPTRPAPESNPFAQSGDRNTMVVENPATRKE